MNIEITMAVIGWLGAAAVLYAYIMISADKMKVDSVQYQFFNIIGAVFLIINTAFNQAYPSTVVNIIWVFIAVYSVLKITLKKRAIAKQEPILQMRPIRSKRNFPFFRKRA